MADTPSSPAELDDYDLCGKCGNARWVHNTYDPRHCPAFVDERPAPSSSGETPALAYSAVEVAERIADNEACVQPERHIRRWAATVRQRDAEIARLKGQLGEAQHAAHVGGVAPAGSRVCRRVQLDLDQVNHPHCCVKDAGHSGHHRCGCGRQWLWPSLEPAVSSPHTAPEYSAANFEARIEELQDDHAAECARLRAEVERWQRAFQHYSGHDADCPRIVAASPCKCGYSDLALAAATPPAGDARGA